jgi:hypothetical protein
MKERKGQNTSIWRRFLGFGSVLTGVGADRLNRLCPLDRLFYRPSVLEPVSNA